MYKLCTLPTRDRFDAFQERDKIHTPKSNVMYKQNTLQIRTKRFYQG